MIYRIGSIPYDSNYLEHFGILGMKWGVRRYQNPDGSLTEAGKVRYGNYSDLDKGQRKEAGRISRVQDEIGQNALGVGRSASNIARRFSKKSTKNSPAKKMTDEELRRVVNRLNLEQQYNRLTGEDTRQGAVIIGDIIDTVGDIAAISLLISGVVRKIRSIK